MTTALPAILTATAAAAPATTAAAAPPTRQTAPADFFFMLGQLLSTAAQGAPTGDAALVVGEEDEDLELPEELMAALAQSPLAASLPTHTEPLTAKQLASAMNVVVEVQIARTAARESQSFVELQAEAPLADAAAAELQDAQLRSDGVQQSPTRSLTPSQAEPAYARPVQSPVGTTAWADDIGSRLTMMAEQGKYTASLRLSPEHLGPLEVRIAIRDDQASVWFGAAHADTRAAIEHALPRLRELFAAQGMSLTDAGVSHEAPREQAAASQAASSGRDGEAAEPSAALSAVVIKLGLVDAYA